MTMLPQHHESIAKQEVEALTMRIHDAEVALMELRRMLALALGRMHDEAYQDSRNRAA